MIERVLTLIMLAVLWFLTLVMMRGCVNDVLEAYKFMTMEGRKLEALRDAKSFQEEPIKNSNVRRDKRKQ